MNDDCLKDCSRCLSLFPSEYEKCVEQSRKIKSKDKSENIPYLPDGYWDNIDEDDDE